MCTRWWSTINRASLCAINSIMHCNCPFITEHNPNKHYFLFMNLCTKLPIYFWFSENGVNVCGFGVSQKSGSWGGFNGAEKATQNWFNMPIVRVAWHSKKRTKMNIPHFIVHIYWFFFTLLIVHYDVHNPSRVVRCVTTQQFPSTLSVSSLSILSLYMQSSKKIQWNISAEIRDFKFYYLFLLYDQNVIAQENYRQENMNIIQKRWLKGKRKPFIKCSNFVNLSLMQCRKN